MSNAATFSAYSPCGFWVSRDRVSILSNYARFSKDEKFPEAEGSYNGSDDTLVRLEERA